MVERSIAMRASAAARSSGVGSVSKSGRCRLVNQFGLCL